MPVPPGRRKSEERPDDTCVSIEHGFALRDEIQPCPCVFLYYMLTGFQFGLLEKYIVPRYLVFTPMDQYIPFVPGVRGALCAVVPDHRRNIGCVVSSDRGILPAPSCCCA